MGAGSLVIRKLGKLQTNHEDFSESAIPGTWHHDSDGNEVRSYFILVESHRLRTDLADLSILIFVAQLFKVLKAKARGQNCGNLGGGPCMWLQGP